MAADESKNEEVARLIADANRTLARLQSERLRTLSGECLPAYNSWEKTAHRSAGPRAFTMDAETLELLSTELDENDFGDSARADELDRAAEAFALQLRLHRKRLQGEYDVFLCHNSDDKREVRTLASQLRRRGLLPWFDEEELLPGEAWQSRIQTDLDSVKSCTVIVGPSGFGPWQQREVDVILALFVNKGLPTIPVILPSCKLVPELPLFLRSFGWVDYRTLDPDPLEQLVWGICGRRAHV